MTEPWFLVIVKNYFGDGWKVLKWFSGTREEVVYECATHPEAKRYYDAERAAGRAQGSE